MNVSPPSAEYMKPETEIGFSVEAARVVEADHDVLPGLVDRDRQLGLSAGCRFAQAAGAARLIEAGLAVGGRRRFARGARDGCAGATSAAASWRMRATSAAARCPIVDILSTSFARNSVADQAVLLASEAATVSAERVL